MPSAVTSPTRRHVVVTGIIAAIAMTGLSVVAPMAESATPFDEQTRGAIRAMQSRHSAALPTATGDATATPTPRVIVVKPTPTPSSPATATAPPNRAALPTATPAVITIETPAPAGATSTPTATAAPTAPGATSNRYSGTNDTADSNRDPVAHGHTDPVATRGPDVGSRSRRSPAVHRRGLGRRGYYRGDSQAYGRPWVAVYGALSEFPRATLGFTLDATPGRAATISITGLDDEWGTLNPIALEVNGEPVFSGPSPFVNWDGVGNGANAAWTTIPFTIPSGILRAGPNEITFANLTPVASFNAPPYVLLADAILEISVQAPEDDYANAVPIVPSSTAAAFTAADWSGAFYRGDAQFTVARGRPSTAPRAHIRKRRFASDSTRSQAVRRRSR